MAGTDVRFLVERPVGQREAGQFDDVGAENGFEVTHGGALVFFGPGGEQILAYAPQAWLSVVSNQ